MTWTYSQSTGILRRPDGEIIAIGYAGRNDGLNNPALQSTFETGPLPRGFYSMVTYLEKHPRLGLCVILLEPRDNSMMFGRGGFAIHGLDMKDILHSSHGCIVVGDCFVRRSVWMDACKDLEVIL